MSTAIDTTRVAERRVLHFNSLADILADVERLAQAREVRNLGNWSPGQVINHLAVVMNKSIDGFEQKAPKIVRFFIRLFMKRRFLTKTMAPGFKLPRRAQAELVLPPVTLEEGVANFRRAFERLQKESPHAAHPALGVLTPEEWQQLHCRHSELHLSFLVPVD